MSTFSTSSLTPAGLRKLCREGALNSHTSGLAPGFVQANLVILPEKYTNDFVQFCKQNPRSCPLISVSTSPGETSMERVAANLDIRSDLPKYNIFRSGVLESTVDNIRADWRDEFRFFLIGCSFSFEEALLNAGLEIRNISEQKNVPMYLTDRDCKPAGVFRSKLVVSMRPMKEEDAHKAFEICKNYPHVHGEPFHMGDPEELGIADLHTPDFGEAVSIYPGEIPVFWACGVTPQIAVIQSAPEIAITHCPGHMLITDLKNTPRKHFTPPLIP